jgi:DNA-directed RNA polymerase subunit RPC12/RpoP
MTDHEYPCPNCGENVAPLGGFGRMSRDSSGEVRSHTKEMTKCEKCGAKLERTTLLESQWEVVEEPQAT